jgi:SAM-dependent methyltransferase
MDDLSLLIDLHIDGERQGPGSDACTQKALQLAGFSRDQPLRIADLGCGTGASAMVLAEELHATVIAVDLLQPFLDTLTKRAQERGVADQIETLCWSIDALPFENQSLDVIWSEGAIYNIGFAEGARSWKRYLKPGGHLVVSEITWLTAERPAELNQHWEREYPEIGLASEKVAVLEKLGYVPEAFFVLPEDCWIDHYYKPMQERFAAYLERNNHSADARGVVAAEEVELDLYKKYRAFFSYGVYVARVPAKS